MYMNKKNLTLTIIAVVTLLVVVVSATFAYFTAIINTEENSTTIVSGSAEDIGTVALSNPTEDLHITLSATDMAHDNLGVYYATDSETANYDTEEVQRNIAVATVSGGSTSTKYECSATINIELDGTMAESIVAGDAYVQFGGIIDNKVQLSKVLEDGYKVVFQLDGGTNTSKSVSASIAIENKMQNQNNLAGKTLSATFSNDNFSCKVVKEHSDTSKTAFAIYSETDNSLKFYKRENVPEVGDTFNGNKVTEVYTGIEDAEYEYTGESIVPQPTIKDQITYNLLINQVRNTLSTDMDFNFDIGIYKNFEGVIIECRQHAIKMLNEENEKEKQLNRTCIYFRP